MSDFKVAQWRRSPVLLDTCLREGCGKPAPDGSGYCSDECFHEDWHLDMADLAPEPPEEGRDYP